MTTRTGSEAAEEAIAKLDAEEGDETHTPPANDDGAGKPAAGEDDKGDGGADKPADKPAGDDKKDDKPDDKKDEGFTADDAVEVDDKPKDDKPEAPKDAAGVVLSPAEQTYIRENIGEPIVIRGIQGEGDEAKEVEIKAYTFNDIPANFKFQSEAQRIATLNGFQNLERRAEELLGNFRTNQSKTAAADFEKRENEGIRSDVADLQKEGLFPKFKVQPGQEGFDDDPAAKQMAEVLDLMTKANEQYLKEYEQGRPYRHIGFRDAFERWENQNARSKRAADEKAAQDKEDEERKKTARNNNDESRATPGGLNIMKPTVRPGTTVSDIIDRHELED